MPDSATFHEDVFYQFFRPFRHPDAGFDVWGGHGLETFGSDLEIARNYDSNFVWTVLDGERDQWIVPGFHRVNRICYLLSEVSHQCADIQFRVFSSSSSLTSVGLARRMTTLRKSLRKFPNPSRRFSIGSGQ